MLFTFQVYNCRVNITYIDKSGKSIQVKGKVGDNVMYLAHRYNIEIEGTYTCVFYMTTLYPHTHRICK